MPCQVLQNSSRGRRCVSIGGHQVSDQRISGVDQACQMLSRRGEYANDLKAGEPATTSVHEDKLNNCQAHEPSVQTLPSGLTPA